MSRIRLSAAALSHLGETQAAYDARAGKNLDSPEVALFDRIEKTPRRKDGSVTIDVNARGVDILLDYAEAWAIGAGQSFEWEDGPGELNAARALVRNLTALAGEEG